MSETHTPNPSLSVLSRKIAFSTIVQYVGKGFQLFLSAWTLKIIANLLSQGDYGVYAAVAEYAIFFSVAANLGIFGHTLRKMADTPTDGKIFYHAFLLRVATAFFFMCVAIIYLVTSGADTIFFLGASLFLGSLLFDYVSAVCDAALQANYMMGKATFALIAGRIIQFASTCFLVYSISGPMYGLVPILYPGKSDVFATLTQLPLFFLAPLAGSIVTALICLFFIHKKISWSWKIDRVFLRQFFIACLPFGIINILNNLYFRFLPDYFAHNALTSEQFGSFNIFFRVAQVLSLLSTFLMFSVLPGFKQYLDTKHFQKAHELYKKVWKILALCGVLLVVGGTLVGPFAIELLTHKKYILPELWFVLPLMLTLAAVSYGYDLILITLFAFEDDIWLLKNEALALLIAACIFGFSNIPMPPETQLLFILLAAIVGETCAVVRGLMRTRKLFHQLS